MSKIRVYSLAKMFEMSNTEMVELLTEIGVSIKSHMSSIDEEVSLLVEDELKRRKDAEEKKAVEAITTYPVVNISEGASVSDIAASIGEKPGSAVKILMAEGLMVPATVEADEKILEILGKGFERRRHQNQDDPHQKPEKVAAEEHGLLSWFDDFDIEVLSGFHE